MEVGAVVNRVEELGLSWVSLIDWVKFVRFLRSVACFDLYPVSFLSCALWS